MTSLFNSHFYVHPTDPVGGAAKSNRILEHYLSHMNLLNTGRDVELLAEAFSNMANLSTVGIRDFNSRSRRRDYPNVEWRSKPFY
jgi:hypothetical protein